MSRRAPVNRIGLNPRLPAGGGPRVKPEGRWPFAVTAARKTWPSQENRAVGPPGDRTDCSAQRVRSPLQPGLAPRGSSSGLTRGSPPSCKPSTKSSASVRQRPASQAILASHQGPPLVDERGVFRERAKTDHVSAPSTRGHRNARPCTKGTPTPEVQALRRQKNPLCQDVARQPKALRAIRSIPRTTLDAHPNHVRPRSPRRHPGIPLRMRPL